MKPTHLLLAPLTLPAICPQASQAMPEHQRYDTSYQWYQEDDHRMQIESFYLRGEMDINADTFFRFQYLRDSISGSSPTGMVTRPDQRLATIIPDVREGVMAALAHQFDDHRVEFEISRSEESDYLSTGLALSDKWDLNQKNTTLAFGINYLTDDVSVPGTTIKNKTGVDLFTGITQVIDKNTVVTANLTLGYSGGYLNDPYKTIERDQSAEYSLPPGTLILPCAENRPDQRLREVLQLEGTHYFEQPNGALDAVIRFSHDDYGVFSQCLQLEWRQAVGEKLEITPFTRYYHQNAADFFANSLDNVLPYPAPVPDYPDGSSPNYSADYRLSSLQSYSLGLRLRYQLNSHFAANASYERYIMHGVGSDQSPSFAYPSADIWTIGLTAQF